MVAVNNLQRGYWFLYVPHKHHSDSKSGFMAASVVLMFCGTKQPWRKCGRTQKYPDFNLIDGAVPFFYLIELVCKQLENWGESYQSYTHNWYFRSACLIMKYHCLHTIHTHPFIPSLYIFILAHPHFYLPNMYYIRLKLATYFDSCLYEIKTLQFTVKHLNLTWKEEKNTTYILRRIVNDIFTIVSNSPDELDHEKLKFIQR